jgi:cellulose synthase/poly-beta-1,6-N-acetylglucosamine synthase-like glycosyltransferase
VFAIELLLGLLPGGPRLRPSSAKIAVLMPAHNEASGIGAILLDLKQRLPEQTRIIVVADNCADDTAEVARAAGAEAIVRTDPDKRGKGYALAFGRDHLRGHPPDCVIVLDADCLPEPGAFDALAAQAMQSGRPVQSCYLLTAQPEGPPMIQISGFAFLVKNLIRQRGLMRLHAPVVLTGSGMAFPWRLFDAADLATGNIVEDLVLGVELARAGHAPLFAPDARVWTDPSSSSGTLTQRTRWEHGFIGTARTQAVPLVIDGLRRGRPGLVWLGLHLATPPLALLLMLSFAVLAIEALLHGLGAGAGAFAALSVLLAIMLLLAGAVWIGHGREQMRAATLFRIPLYLLWKLPVYLRLVRGGETRWIRTARESD